MSDTMDYSLVQVGLHHMILAPEYTVLTKIQMMILSQEVLGIRICPLTSISP